MGLRIFTAMIAIDCHYEEGQRSTPEEELKMITHAVDDFVQRLPKTHMIDILKFVSAANPPTPETAQPQNSRYVLHIDRGGLLRYSQNGSTSYENYADKKEDPKE